MSPLASWSCSPRQSMLTSSATPRIGHMTFDSPWPCWADLTVIIMTCLTWWDIVCLSKTRFRGLRSVLPPCVAALCRGSGEGDQAKSVWRDCPLLSICHTKSRITMPLNYNHKSIIWFCVVILIWILFLHFYSRYPTSLVPYKSLLICLWLYLAYTTLQIVPENKMQVIKTNTVAPSLNQGQLCAAPRVKDVFGQPFLWQSDKCLISAQQVMAPKPSPLQSHALL